MCLHRLQTVLLVDDFAFERDVLREIVMREGSEILALQGNEGLPAEVDRVALNVVMDLAVLAHEAVSLDKERFIVA